MFLIIVKGVIMSIIDFGMKTIHSYLTDKTYSIPDYQREYSWTEDQLEDFWEDLYSTVKSDRHHFFGQIVIHKESDDKYFIIDGQQRTVTSVIFLAVLRDMFSKFEADSDEAQNHKEDIRIKYIGRWTARKDELRLHLGISDRDYFKEHIQKSHPSNDGSTPSQKRIYSAYSFLEKKIDELISECISDTDRCVDILIQYYDTFLESFDLMTVTTDDINEAFIIFETLNARGKELETADLLKNYVFMQAGNNIESVKSKWINMLDSLDNKDDATKFIRYYWNATHDFTREKNLYKEISRSIKPNKCEPFVSALSDLADVYNALSIPEDNKYFSDNEISALLINLSTMKASTFYPVIFALCLKGFSEEDIKQVLKALEVLVFRNFVVAGLTANRYEIIFADLAKEISSNEKDRNSIVSAIVENTIDDETFNRSLIGLEIKTVTIAKYILREIEDYGDGEKITSKDNKAINLEHIMPKKNTQWNVQPDIHKKYLYRLANQTLLLDEYNKAASNKKFDKKKEMYQKSTINMTLKLCDYPKWDVTAINKREQELISVILKRWALPN